MTRLEGHILTPEGFRAGVLEVGGSGRIAAVEGRSVTSAEAVSSGRPLLLPGFIDLHVHGGGGRDLMDGGDAAAEVARFHGRLGTTSLAATTVTATPEALQRTFRDLAPHVANRPSGGARILGAHLEGPYLSARKLGAQPPHARAMDLVELDALHAQVPIRLLTLAPEFEANRAAIPALLARGIRVQVGHTEATYEEALEALGHGATGFTHLFNAMSPLHHRQPGVVGAALARGRYAEIIPDLLHVHPGAIHAALRAIPGLYCVTDATAAAGMPDGEYPLGEHRVTKCLGAVRLADGTLAGSALTLDQALRNLVGGLGLELPEASRRVSTYAADHLGLEDRGRLVPGAWADVVVLDSELRVRGVLVEGERLDLDA